MNSIELFAGGGGLALGFHDAQVDHEVVCEWDADSCATLRKNWTDPSGLNLRTDIREGDVRDMDFREFEGRVDLVTGGPPCQPFSIGGKAQGYNDQRDMFPQAARVVRETRPRAFVFENVRGLLRRSFSKYFQYVLLQLTYPEVGKRPNDDWLRHLSRLESHHTRGNVRGLEYRVLFRLVNAADYGVPQKRERVVIVGFRSDIQEPWNFPVATHSEDALHHAKWVTGTYWDEHRIANAARAAMPDNMARRVANLAAMPFNARWRTVRDAIGHLPDPRSPEANRIQGHRFRNGARAYAGHTGSPIDDPAKTLKAGDHGVPGGENMLCMPDGTVRYFTTRESALLQTFPDWYSFPGSWTESMRQIGNAVPVRLAHTIATSVTEALVAHERRLTMQN